MKKLLLVGVVAASALLAGCQSSADRMYECEAQGVSRDACYVAEQNRKANINSAAEKQALENAHEATANVGVGVGSGLAGIGAGLGLGLGSSSNSDSKHHHKHHHHQDQNQDQDDSEDDDSGEW